MSFYKIAIGGQVQGVGFRPFVQDLARQYSLKGFIRNDGNGVCIIIEGNKDIAEDFVHFIRSHHPMYARIDRLEMTEIREMPLPDGFEILRSEASSEISAEIPPDLAMCETCRKELNEPLNRRYQYPFITCLNCGPRASVIRGLPYDRERTSMSCIQMCKECQDEYHEPRNRRQHSQTNSCPKCPIEISIFDSSGRPVDETGNDWLSLAISWLREGGLVAIKGIGGYHLLADAASQPAIQTLRKKKHRPGKPFAVLYPDLESAAQDVFLNEWETTALLSPAAPIVLCNIRSSSGSGIQLTGIAPGLDKLGVILPYTPMLELLAKAWQHPLILTSANVSGSAILYRDMDALSSLIGLADLIISHNREIVMPLEDSVMQFTPSGQQIFLRKGRGYALNEGLLKRYNSLCLATGADLKASFAFTSENCGLVSLYLGNLSDFTVQEQMETTYSHLSQLYHFRPEVILSDAHPGYLSTLWGKELAKGFDIRQITIQHHEAHFAAVLEEHQLWDEDEPVLGVIWDGTGYGNDGQIWGGEFFILYKRKMKRICNLDYFPVIAGDKMSLEPRLSALSMLHHTGISCERLRVLFKKEDWDIYMQLIQGSPLFYTSSMGRLLDAISALLGICNVNIYEGEAAMKLETAARSYAGKSDYIYSFQIEGEKIYWQDVLLEVIREMDSGVQIHEIACRIHECLAVLIVNVAQRYGVAKIAFSGGVFQNALLCERIAAHTSGRCAAYFHQLFPPNDCCIAFGQVAHYKHVKR